MSYMLVPEVMFEFVGDSKTGSELTNRCEYHNIFVDHFPRWKWGQDLDSMSSISTFQGD